jgi:hypothetical protein
MIYQMLILLLKRILLKTLLAMDTIKMERLHLNRRSAGTPFLSNFRHQANTSLKKLLMRLLTASIHLHLSKQPLIGLLKITTRCESLKPYLSAA